MPHHQGSMNTEGAAMPSVFLVDMGYGPRIDYGRLARRYILPIIFCVVYFLLIAMLWVNARWFRELDGRSSPALMTVVWLVVFIGIVWTWIKCLKHTPSGWVHFWFVINMLLVLLCGWAFFISRNLPFASFVMFLLVLSTITLIFVAAKHWTPGVIWMLFYLAVLLYSWFAMGRFAMQSLARKTRINSEFLRSAMGLSPDDSLLSGINKLFTMDEEKPKPAAPAAPAARAKSVPLPARPDAPVHGAAAMTPPATPRDSWRSRGLSDNEL